MLFLSFCSFWYGKNIVFYLSGLGTDSLLEIQSFDLIEALGFLKTLKVALLANHFHFSYKGYLLLFILFMSAMLIFKFFSTSNKRRIFLSLILVSFSIAVLGVETASMMIGNTKFRAGLAENSVVS